MPRNRAHYRVKLSEALFAHECALNLSGGLHGVRDQGLIEAALARPYCGYYRLIEQKAAALLHSLALNHGFVDGNKRTALLMVPLMLRKSGYRLRHKDPRQRNAEMEDIILAVVERRVTFDELVEWFRQRVTRA